jgi:chromosome segregation ATPase
MWAGLGELGGALQKGLESVNVEAITDSIANIVAPLEEEDLEELDESVKRDRHENMTLTSLNGDITGSKEAFVEHEDKLGISSSERDSSMSDVNLDSSYETSPIKELSVQPKIQDEDDIQTQIQAPNQTRSHREAQQPIVFLGNPEFERRISVKYRDQIEDELVSSSGRVKELEVLLEHMSEQLKAVIEERDNLSYQIATSSVSDSTHEGDDKQPQGDPSDEVVHLQQRIKILEAECDETSQRILVTEKSLQEMRGENHTLKSDVSTLRGDIIELRVKNKDMEEEITGYKDELERLKNNMSSSDSSIKELQNELQDKMAQLDTMEKTNEILKKEVAATKTIIVDLEKEKNQLKESLTAALEKGQSRSVPSQEYVDALEKEKVSLEKRLDETINIERQTQQGLESRNEALSREIKEKESLEKCIDDMKSNLNAAKIEIKKGNEDRKALESNIESVKKDLLEKSEKLKEVESALNVANVLYSDTEKVTKEKIEGMKEEMKQVRMEAATKMASSDVTRKKLDVELSVCKTEIERLNVAIGEAQTEVQSVGQKVEDIQATKKKDAKIIALNTEMGNLRTELSSSQMLIVEIQGKLDMTSAKLKTVEGDLENSRKSSEAGEKKISELRTEIKVMNESMGRENDEKMAVLAKEKLDMEKSLKNNIVQVEKDFKAKIMEVERERALVEKTLQDLQQKHASELENIRKENEMELDQLNTRLTNLSSGAVAKFDAMKLSLETEMAQKLDEVNGEKTAATSRMENALSDLEMKKKEMGKLTGLFSSLENQLKQKDLELAQMKKSITVGEEERTKLANKEVECAELKVQVERVDSEAKALEELLQVATTARDEARLEAESAINRSQELEDIEMKLHAELNKSQAEIKKLNTVISQLRSARRTTKEDFDSLKSKLDVAVEKERVATESVNRLKEELLIASRREEELQERLQTATAEVALEESAVTRSATLESALDASERDKARIEKILYDKDCELEALRADVKLLNLDLERKSLENSNYIVAMENLEQEKVFAIRRADTALSQRLEEAAIKSKADADKLFSSFEIEKEELHNRVKEMEQLRQDEALLRRKAELEMRIERETMQKSVERAVEQMRAASDDVVDRALIANTLVMYFKRRRSVEILELLAKMLAFDEQQLVDVGLKVAPKNFITNFLTTILPPVEEEPDIGDKNNIAEVWLDFLLQETDSDNVGGDKSEA